MSINLNIELYKKDGSYHAYISDDKGGSGIKEKAETREELCAEIFPDIMDYLSEI